MNAVGIDVSKGHSTICVMRPFGEIVASPFEVNHTDNELSMLADKLKNLTGETKIIMECTGTYHLPLAYALYESGLDVYIVNPLLIHGFGNNSIRKVKTDKADSVKIANYGLNNWLDLHLYIPEDDVRQMLKVYSRQYNKYNKLKTILKNNLISLLEQTFPGVNELFTSPPRKSDGHEKWIDFAKTFWHCECICSLSQKSFVDRYHRWCKSNSYNFSQSKAEDVFISSLGHINVMPKNKTTKFLVTQAIVQINTISEAISSISKEMKRLATTLPEYPVAIDFFGVGEIHASQIMAEIGDIYRFKSKNSLVAFAGLDAPPFQSGQFEAQNRSISKKGTPHLRKSLFLVMKSVIQKAPIDDPIYQFLDRKRAEGKHYYSYMTAGSAKFLRIYYARVKEYLDNLYSIA